MLHPTPAEKAYITAAAISIGANPNDLNALIAFESNYNPQAANPHSTAKGILQFTNAAARDIGYTDSTDLINKNPSFAAQVKNAVIPYLKKYAPYPTQQALYMAVFYPQAREWPIDTHFPPNVQAANPGIVTVKDYLNKVNSKKLLPLILPYSIILIAALIFLFTRRETINEKTPE